MKYSLWLLPFFSILLFISCDKDADHRSEQKQSLEFQKTYGGDLYDVSHSAVEFNHQLYLLGTTRSFGDLKGDLYLLKLDTSGNVIDEITYGGLHTEEGLKISVTQDQHLLLLGTRESPGTGKKDILIIKVNASGEVIWEKTYGGDENDTPAGVIETSAGEYCIAGTSESFGPGSRDIILLWIDQNGNFIKEKFYGSTDFDGSSDLLEIENNEIMVYGYTRNFGAVSRDLYLLKVNAHGDSLWSKRLGGDGYEESQSFLRTADGSYLLHGHSASVDPVHNMYSLKIDSSGNTLWDIHIGGAMHDGGQASIINADGNYALVGRSMSYGEGDRNIILAVVNPEGTQLSFEVIGSEFNERAEEIIEIGSYYYLIGHVAERNDETSDVLVIKKKKADSK